MQVTYLTTALHGCISTTQYFLCEHLMYLDITIRHFAQQEADNDAPIQ